MKNFTLTKTATEFNNILFVIFSEEKIIEF